MTIALLVVAFLMLWAGVALILDGWPRRHPDLAERLRPYGAQSLAEEAEDWLRWQPWA